MSAKDRQKRQRLMRSLMPCFQNTAMLMTLVGTEMRKHSDRKYTSTKYTKCCRVSRETKSSGWSHGVTVEKGTTRHPSGTWNASVTLSCHDDVVLIFTSLNNGSVLIEGWEVFPSSVVIARQSWKKVTQSETERGPQCLCRMVKQQTRELISARKTSQKDNNKDLSRPR